MDLSFRNIVWATNNARYLIAFLLLLTTTSVFAQIYPVQSTVQLLPPYSVYLSDYASPGNDRLKLIMIQRDVSKPSYQVRLFFSIELNGKTILRTSQGFNPHPIILDPGVPMIISGTDLLPYLDSRNLEFIGYSQNEYERTKSLPEGNYQICVRAYDYRRPDVQVSSEGCSFYWLAKSEPPLINQPFCASDIPIQNPQQILFSWLPRNTSSPGSVNETEYEFSLYEVRPQGRNPNDVVLSSAPVFRTTTPATQLVYGPAEPLLINDLTYAWRVRAIDKNGRDQFRNDGYSEVCTFTYGGIDAKLPQIENVVAEGIAERKGKVSWTTSPDLENYKVGYKKRGNNYEWFTSQAESGELTLFDLEPDTEYEVRVQGSKEGVFGQYSDIASFSTLKKKVFNCGDELPPLPEPGNPLPAATVGTIIDVHGLELILTDVTNSGGPGVYKGTGRVSVPYLGGASFNAVFNNLFIDENRVATSGRIDFITKSIDNWVEEELAEQRKDELEEQQNKNRSEWAGTDFHEEITYYDEIEIEDIRVEDGKLVIVGEDNLGNKVELNNTEVIRLADATGKAVIIEDKNGDQWVVQAGGKVSKVPGGGLSPTMDVYVSEEAQNYLKEALIALRIDYDEKRMKEVEQQLTRDRAVLDEYIQQYNASQLSDAFTTESVESDDYEQIDEAIVGFEVIESDNSAMGQEEDDFVKLSRAYKAKELEYNRGLVIEIITGPTAMDKTAEIIAPEIKVGDKSVTQFVEQEKIQRSADSNIVGQIKVSIESFLDKLIAKASSRNPKINELRGVND